MGHCKLSGVPALPPGFQLETKPTKKPKSASKKRNAMPPLPSGFSLEQPTGEVVDGDTLRLHDGNARLWGVDAFEAKQNARDRSGLLVPIGEVATNRFDKFITPNTNLYDTGNRTWNRPVVGADNDGDDIGRKMLSEGLGFVTPEYLKQNPEKLKDYMETERLARQNRFGAHKLTAQTPEDWRKSRGAERDDSIAVFKDEPIPWGGLRPEIESGYLALFADPNTTAKDLQKYATTHNFSVNSREAINSIQNTGREKFRSAWLQDNLGIDSSGEKKLVSWLNSNRGKANVTPEILQGLYAKIGVPAEKLPSVELLGEMAQQVQAGTVKFGGFNTGTTSEMQTKLAELAALPKPMTNAGDGAMGAAGRGVGDTATIGMQDELGGVFDSLGATEGRENIFNSDRRFGDVLWNNIDQNRAIISHDEENHPYARFGGQIAGAFALPYASGARTPAALARIGALEGGAYGFGSSEGGFTDRLSDVPLPAAAGGAGGFVLGKVANAFAPQARRFVDDAKSRFGRPVAQEAVQEIPPPPPGYQVETIDSGLDVPMLSDDIPPPPAGYKIEAMDSGLSNPTLRSDLLSSSSPQSLSQNPIGDNILAASRRMEPDDIIPIPSNQVDGVADAAQIQAGRFDTLKPVDEKTLLEGRAFQSQSNPEKYLTHKGPMDLISWVRARGGLNDAGDALTKGGDLKAMGLNNGRRQMDFAQNDTRMGALIDNENGGSLDDMAEAAWDAGYFPDHVERPSVDEFLEALGDTYSGNNRRFMQDDFDEVDAFYGQQSQNSAIGKAQEDGAPLVNDLSEPVGPDDFQVPPDTAYQDWPTGGIGKVGNINVSKLDSPQDIQRALKATHDAVSGFDDATRGKVTHEATARLASDLNMSADQLLKRRKGQAFNAEEALAARQILAESGNELVNMAKKLKGVQEPGDEALSMFQRAIVRHAAIQEQVSGATAEAGRALSAFRMTADSREAGLVMNNLVRAGGGTGRIQDAADAIIDLAEQPGRLNKFIDKASRKRLSAPIVELWYNSLLSGPQTHIVNAMGNTLTSLTQLPEQALSASIGAARRGLGIGKDQDRVLFSEIGGRSIGMLQGVRAGLKDGLKTIMTGNPSDLATKVEDQGQKAIPGLVGKTLKEKLESGVHNPARFIGSTVRIPTKALGAADEFFKAVARNGELNALAIRRAHSEGLSGQAAKDRIADLVSNPSDAMVARARDFSRYVTFTRPLGPLGSKVQGITEEAPILKAILPFVRTPSNLFKYSIERSPAAPIMKEWRNEIRAGGARRDTAIARAVFGSGMMAIAAQAAAEGTITGALPSDKNRANLLRANGWQPYSIKIGDKYHSYQRMDPFASIIGSAADLATMGDGQTDKQRDKGAALIVASVLSNMTSKTWLSGMTDFLAVIDDPERNSEWFLKRLSGSVAVPSVVAQAARVNDPVMRDSETIGEYISSRVPGMSQDLQPRRDVWGKPIVSESGISPIWQSSIKNDPITSEMLEVGGRITKPGRTVGGERLGAATYGRYQELTGNLARQSIGGLIVTPEYQAMSDDDKQDLIRKIVSKAKRDAREQLFAPQNVEQSLPVPQSSNRIPPPPPGFVLDNLTARRSSGSRERFNDIPPPPAGFVVER